MNIIFGILLAGITLLAVSLQKTYHHLPAMELKRRARRGDEYAQLLYRVVAYDISLDLLLWILVGVSAAGFFVITSRSISAWVAFVGALSVVWFGFAWLPNGRVTKFGMQLAGWLVPPLARILEIIHPITHRVGLYLQRFQPITLHTGLYEKEDLLGLIESQKVQTYNKIDEAELKIASHALTFGEKLVKDYMTPRRMIRFVSHTDPIGPILLGELHDSGFSRFPVTGNDPNQVVGTLFLHDLVDKNVSGKVKDVMSKQVYYVKDDWQLERVLKAFLKTKRHLFMVVNNFEDVVGLITFEDVLEQILGQRIVDEFDQYDDLRVVATHEAKVEREIHEEKIPPESPEVIE